MSRECPKVISWRLATLLLLCIIVVVPAASHDRSPNAEVRSRRRAMFDAQVERNNLKQKLLKRLNTVEGKLKLIGGSGDHEGEEIKLVIKRKMMFDNY